MVCASSAFFRFSSLISLADSDVTPRRPPGVDLGLRHPPAQRLGAHPQPAGARPDRSELRLVVTDMITNQQYRPSPGLRVEPACHEDILPNLEGVHQTRDGSIR